ncbi:MAG: hypothetical protein ACXQT2_00130 [Methanotrichaceae archaeon]
MKKIAVLLVLAMAVFVLPAVAQDWNLPEGVATMQFDGTPFDGGMVFLVATPNANIKVHDLGSQMTFATSNARATNYLELISGHRDGAVTESPLSKSQEVVKSQSKGETSLISSETNRMLDGSNYDSRMANIMMIRTGGQTTMATGTGIFGRAVASNHIVIIDAPWN